MEEETLVVTLPREQHISADLRRQTELERAIECVVEANRESESMKWLNYMEVDAELWRQWHGKEFLPCFTREAQKGDTIDLIKG